ncbi:MAG: hypothetical protein OEV17_11210 [Nitrospira sp.]|nr:hypothetical protein [Nitrospira sp.]
MNTSAAIADPLLRQAFGRRARPYDPDEVWLLPPSPQEWLPENHLAYFLSDLVETLTLTPILQTSHLRLTTRRYDEHHLTILRHNLLFTSESSRDSITGLNKIDLEFV